MADIDPLALPVTLPPGHGRGATPDWPPDKAGMIARLLDSPNGRFNMGSLATAAGMHRSGVRQILLGWVRPTLGSGLRMARALGISPWTLLEFSERVRGMDRHLAARKRKPKHFSNTWRALWKRGEE